VICQSHFDRSLLPVTIHSQPHATPYIDPIARVGFLSSLRPFRKSCRAVLLYFGRRLKVGVNVAFRAGLPLGWIYSAGRASKYMTLATTDKSSRFEALITLWCGESCPKIWVHQLCPIWIVLTSTCRSKFSISPWSTKNDDDCAGSSPGGCNKALTTILYALIHGMKSSVCTATTCSYQGDACGGLLEET